MKPLPPETDRTPHAHQSRLAGVVGRCLVVVFLSGWTAGTLCLDLMAATGLVLGFCGEALFLALFSVPFNAVLLLLWGLIAARALVPGTTSPWYGTGIRIMDRGHEVRFRVLRITPLGAAFLTAFVLPVLTVLPLGTLGGGKPSLPLAASAFGLVLASIAAAPVIVARRIANGKTDLVIDRLRSTFSLPPTFGRGESVMISCADLVRVRVLTEETKDSDGCVMRNYAVTAEWHDATGGLQQGTLAKLTGEEAAEALVLAIRHEALGSGDWELGRATCCTGGTGHTGSSGS